MQISFHKAVLGVAAILFSQLSNANDAFYGKIRSIPTHIKKLMVGRTWHQGCPITMDQLAYLQLSFWGFDDKPHVGELIVYRPLAKETLAIFKELFEIKFPIERMELPEHLSNKRGAIAPGIETSDANNTSGFYCRRDTQTSSKLSTHSYGISIDINPRYNPAIDGKAVEPKNGQKYLDRHLNHPGMIKEGDPVFLIFTKHGWYWGGYFKQVDYMHFTKLITRQYLVKEMVYIPEERQIKSLDLF